MLSQLGTSGFVEHQIEQDCSISQAFSPQPESIEAGLSGVMTIFLMDHEVSCARIARTLASNGSFKYCFGSSRVM